MLSLSRTSWLEIVAEAWRVYPLEACGLVTATAKPYTSDAPTGIETVDRQIEGFIPINNAAQSSRIFQLDPMGYLKAERAADDAGLEVVGVVHSHTHTAAYPSPTDVSEATKELVPHSWHWAIVSLAWGYPELRSFRVDAKSQDWSTLAGIAEEQVLLR